MVRPLKNGPGDGSDGKGQLTSSTISMSSHADCSSVAAVAASSVDGYLRNASRRLRVPAAEGGRGTRRKADMVTSKVAVKKDALESLLDEEQRDGARPRASEAVPVVDADDEWDEVELSHVSNYAAVKKSESDTRATTSKSESNTALKSERDAGQQQEQQEQPQPASSLPGVKLEHLQQQQLHDHVTSPSVGLHSSAFSAALQTSSNDETAGGDHANDAEGEVMMRGARPPLIEQQQNEFSRWRQSDPAYAALMEQRDLLAAQRRSERIQATCKSIVELMSVVIRGRMLWREAHHPRLAKRLLHMRAARPRHTHACGEDDAQGASFSLAATSMLSHGVQAEYFFLHAVIAARELLQRAGDLSVHKRSLAPTWVTLSKDGLGNATSQAILVLLRAINDHFELSPASYGSAPQIDDQDNRDGHASSGLTSRTASAAPTDADRQLYAWNSALKRQYLSRVLRSRRRGSARCGDVGAHGEAAASGKTTLFHPVYFCTIFIALAHLCNMPCRLVIAKGGHNKKSSPDEESRNGSATTAAESSAAVGGHSDIHSNTNSCAKGNAGGGRTFLKKMSIYVGKSGSGSTAAAKSSAADGNANDRIGSKRGRPGTAEARRNTMSEVRSKRLPTSSFWVEVWSAERECFTAVNPCATCTTLWAAPYTFSIDGVVAVDVTARYSSKYSTAFLFNRRLGLCRQYGFLWKDKVAWDDRREVVEVLLLPFCTPSNGTAAAVAQDNGAMSHNAPSTAQAAAAGAHETCDTQTKHALATARSAREGSSSQRASLRALQHTREAAQLESLKYAETVPNTLSALQHHPLFVIESCLARHEAVYPQNASTIVASVKGRTVFKRSAVVSLRSVDGWLREGRSIRAGEVAYKVAAPPTSRPFAQASQFFGLWQTAPFAPLSLSQPSDPIPHHGRTWWYILLDRPAPAGLVHLTQPQIVRVVRRMHVDYGLAVTGFVRRRISERRRGHWEVIIDGIVTKESNRAVVERAYEEWVQLVQEQEAAKRRNRAYQWWLLMIQRLLATDRLKSLYMQGRHHGSLPMW